MAASPKLLVFLLYFAVIYATSHGMETGTIIPLYSYPVTNSGGDAWQKLFNAQKKYPINTWAIVNVYNGPGSGIETNYEKAIRKLHIVGIKTLGYVSTQYGERSMDLVKKDVDDWKRLYNTNGIFFDEMASADDVKLLNYYKELNSYAKSNGFTFTVGNPGTRVDPKYFNMVDNIIVYEEGNGFPDQKLICSQNTLGKGRDHVSIIPYNIPRLNKKAVRKMKSCAGYIYVTDDTLNNPWDTLPNYLSQLFKILKQ